MSDWSQGYVTEIGYTHGYYRELVPSLLAFCALSRGYLAPGGGIQPLRLLELGCGQGFSANLIAASNPHIEYHAIDFNPEQISGAKKLASEAKISNVHFREASFEEIADSSDLGQFDAITLHGIYTWVSAENREHIIHIARHHLKPGGMLYLSYNTYPGWAPVVPIRHLLKQVAAERPSDAVSQRFEYGCEVFDALVAADARCIAASPGLVDRIKRARTLDRKYAVHEYMNKDWTIFHFSDVTDDMARAKATFITSAFPLDHIDEINLTPKQRELLASVANPLRRESMRDLIVNQQFRRDIFQRGAVRLTTAEQGDHWLNQRFALSARPKDIPLKITSGLGEAELKAEIYRPILEGFQGGTRSLREICHDKRVSDLGISNLVQAITLLVGSGQLHPALPDEEEQERERQTSVFNYTIVKRSRYSANYQFLASPVTGSGVPVDRFGQLYLLAKRDAPNIEPSDFIWNILRSQGQNVVVNGKSLVGDAENKAEIGRQPGIFVEKGLPALEKLKVQV